MSSRRKVEADAPQVTVETGVSELSAEQFDALLEAVQAHPRSRSWVDQNPDQLHKDIERRLANRDQLSQWLLGALTQGIDYGSIKTGGKPSLWQPGAEKIASLLNLSHRFPDNERIVESALKGNPLDAVVVRCIVYKDGEEVGEGTGAREIGQSPDLNTRIKMAQKSAFIDAVKRAAGLSDHFTQDDPAAEADETPLGETAEATYLEMKAMEYFPEKYAVTLEGLAHRLFQIPDGDWRKIPRNRLRDALRALSKTAREQGGAS